MSHHRSRGFLGDIVSGLGVGVRLRLAQERPNEALKHLAEAIPLARAHGYGDTGPLLRLLAHVRLSQGYTAKARRLADEAVALSQATGDTQGVAIATATVAAVALACGQSDDAFTHFLQAEARLASASVALASSDRAEFGSGRRSGQPRRVARDPTTARRRKAAPREA